VLILQAILLLLTFSLGVVLNRRWASAAAADGKGSLQLVHKLGGHSLGAVGITAFHNEASDVHQLNRCILLSFCSPARDFPSGHHACRLFSRFKNPYLER
jgi:hypothetical protein